MIRAFLRQIVDSKPKAEDYDKHRINDGHYIESTFAIRDSSLGRGIGSLCGPATTNIRRNGE